MLTPIRIARVQSTSPIVDGTYPSNAFLRTINNALDQIESAINGVINAQNAAEAAQQSADSAASDASAANSAAQNAQTTANSASTAAGHAQSSADSAGTAAAAAQATADSKLSQTTADGLYVHQSNTPTWTAPTGSAARTLSAYSSPTISNPPTQAEVQAISDALATADKVIVGLVTDLIVNKALRS